jgi:ribosomal protein S27AE
MIMTFKEARVHAASTLCPKCGGRFSVTPQHEYPSDVMRWSCCSCGYVFKSRPMDHAGSEADAAATSS